MKEIPQREKLEAQKKEGSDALKDQSLRNEQLYKHAQELHQRVPQPEANESSLAYHLRALSRVDDREPASDTTHTTLDSSKQEAIYARQHIPEVHIGKEQLQLIEKGLQDNGPMIVEVHSNQAGQKSQYCMIYGLTADKKHFITNDHGELRTIAINHADSSLSKNPEQANKKALKRLMEHAIPTTSRDTTTQADKDTSSQNIDGRTIYTVSGADNNCLIHAILKAQGHDPKDYQGVINTIRTDLENEGLAPKGKMLELTEENNDAINRAISDGEQPELLSTTGKKIIETLDKNFALTSPEQERTRLIDKSRGITVSYYQAGELHQQTVKHGSNPIGLFLDIKHMHYYAIDSRA